MNNKTTNLDSVDTNRPAELPEAIAKQKKVAQRDQNRNMRRHFEQMREQQELDQQLLDPFDY
ncbi:MAG: hypothetical protein V7784_13270 [Oceanospirillaceae bacterium]